MVIIGFFMLLWLAPLIAAPFDFEALMKEVSLGDTESISELLDEAEKPIPKLIPQQYGALFTGLAQERDVQKARIVFDAGFLVVSGRDQVGNTLLHYAAQNGNADLVKWLVDHGADVGARNNSNEVPLDRVSKKNVIALSQLLTPQQPLLDSKTMVDADLFAAALRGADINQGTPDATLLQIMLKKFFDSRFESALTDADQENLAKNIVKLIDSDASLDPKIAPKSTKGSYQSPLYYAALSDSEIFEKIVEKKPLLLALELPNKNTILGQLVVEFLKSYAKKDRAAEYLHMLADQIRFAVSKGASLRVPLYGIANFSGSIEELVITQKNKYPELYEIFFTNIVESLEYCAYSLEALRGAL